MGSGFHRFALVCMLITIFIFAFSYIEEHSFRFSFFFFLFFHQLAPMHTILLLCESCFTCEQIELIYESDVKWMWSMVNMNMYEDIHNITTRTRTISMVYAVVWPYLVEVIRNRRTTTVAAAAATRAAQESDRSWENNNENLVAATWAPPNNSRSHTFVNQ